MALVYPGSLYARLTSAWKVCALGGSIRSEDPCGFELPLNVNLGAVQYGGSQTGGIPYSGNE